MAKQKEDPELAAFLKGQSELALQLFDHFMKEYKKIGNVTPHAAKTMIGVSNGNKRVAWITFGKSFMHVVFPFKQAYPDNLCFQKIAQVPGDAKQYNHHFRMLATEDVNEEVLGFMKWAYDEEV